MIFCATVVLPEPVPPLIPIIIRCILSLTAKTVELARWCESDFHAATGIPPTAVGGCVQPQPTKGVLRVFPNPTHGQWVDSFRSGLQQSKTIHLDDVVPCLNDPPTPVGGI